MEHPSVNCFQDAGGIPTGDECIGLLGLVFIEQGVMETSPSINGVSKNIGWGIGR